MNDDELFPSTFFDEKNRNIIRILPFMNKPFSSATRSSVILASKRTLVSTEFHMKNREMSIYHSFFFSTELYLFDFPTMKVVNEWKYSVCNTSAKKISTISYKLELSYIV